MSISSAFNNALSGLRASGRQSEVIATNISNASTEGYVRRTLEVSSTSPNLIGGVTVSGVTRHSDPALLASRREAQAQFGYAQSINAFVSRLEDSLGTPDDPAALINQLADLDARLLEASSRPDAPERLNHAVQAANNVVNTLNSASRDISTLRTEADNSIESQVARLNAALEEVEYLNTQIGQVNLSRGDANSLIDLRQNVIDDINEIAPVNIAERNNGQVALYSDGGVVLIDGSARKLEFTPTRIVVSGMTIEGGQLSGLSFDGTAVRTGSSNGGLPGGTLAAQFAIRDELGTDALTQIDAAARDLVERFQDPAVDPTTTAGEAGLFTDAGGAFTAANEVGLGDRLRLNALVDPAQGGEYWRLRDGLGATTQGPVGQAAQINTLREALSASRPVASGDFGGGDLSVYGVANNMMSRIGVQRLTAEQSLSFASTSFNELMQAERAAGVDTDDELQRMIVVEQAYSANARIIQTIERMMDELMRIGR